MADKKFSGGLPPLAKLANLPPAPEGEAGCAD
jgi:hypothetical protein